MAAKDSLAAALATQVTRMAPFTWHLCPELSMSVTHHRRVHNCLPLRLLRLLLLLILLLLLLQFLLLLPLLPLLPLQ